ncbi:MAG: hypothetical protein PUC47_09790 [Oscillospiraceae bacterium]|nr:hypothetical protein [Oscillospiraceae bacterium]
MPLPMVHLSTALLLEEEGIVRPAERSAYYLGSIAPDAIHMREHPASDAKSLSHAGARSPRFLDRIDSFCQRFPDYERSGISRDYLMGYLVHLLTDIYWKQAFYDGFVQRYREDPAPLQNEKAAYYNDTDVADIRLYKTLPRRPELWALLQAAHGYDLPGMVSAEEVDRWNARTLAWYEVPREYLPVRYASEESIRSFIRTAAERIREYLGEVH